MRSLHDSAPGGEAAGSWPDRSPPASIQPGGARPDARRAREQDAAVEVRAAQAVVQLLHKAVHVRRLYASPMTSGRFVDQLESALTSHLETHHFLRLQVTAHDFVTAGVTLLRDEKRDLPELLWRDGVVELLFKRDVTRRELAQMIEVLHAAGEAVPTADQSVATRLWEAGLAHIVFRCADELPGAETPQVHGVNEPLGLDPEILAVEFLVSSSAPKTASGEANAAAPGRTDVQQMLALVPAERRSLPQLQMEDATAALQRLAGLLVELRAAETEPVVQAALEGSLCDLVEAALRQQRFVLVRGALALLQSGASAGDAEALQPLLDRVLARLCSEENVVRLGGVLDAAQIEGEDFEALRDVLANMRGAVEPLCELLGRLENMQARKLVCRVLAQVAADDPGLLAQHALGEPWYVARNMAYVMGRIGTAQVLTHLKRWSQHGDVRVRVEVARALSKVRHSAAAMLLCDMLGDEESRVRQSAVWSLATLGDPRALPRVRQILHEDRTFRARRVEERDDFFRTFGRLADEATFRELVRLLVQRQLVAVGWQAELRRGAALALGEMTRPEATQLLQQHARSRDAKLREACLSALRSIRNRGSGPAPAESDDWVETGERGDTRFEPSFHLEVHDA